MADSRALSLKSAVMGVLDLIALVLGFVAAVAMPIYGVYFRRRLDKMGGAVLLRAERPRGRRWQWILCAGAFLWAASNLYGTFAATSAVQSIRQFVGAAFWGSFGVLMLPPLSAGWAYVEFRERYIQQWPWEKVREYKWAGPESSTLLIFIPGDGWQRLRLAPEQKAEVDWIMREVWRPAREKAAAEPLQTA